MGGTKLLLQTRSGVTSYYLHDGQGSVRDLTNNTGNITDNYAYSAFGEVYSQTGSTVNNYLYTGQQFDTLTGLYDLRARYYSPPTSQFVSRDTFGYGLSNPSQLNRYIYGMDNPVNAIDPSGYQALVEYEVDQNPEKTAVTEKAGEEFASEAQTLVDETDALINNAGSLGEETTSALNEEANITINGIRSQRVLMGDPDKLAVIGRNMAGRVEPFANGIGAETWDGFDPSLSEAENLANNRAWAEKLVREYYTVYDIGLDPNYVTIGNLDKGPYYEMETQIIFGDP